MKSRKILFGAGWLPRVAKTASKKLEKKFLTKANEFDKINELLIERTAKKFERASKNKIKSS